MTKWTEVSAYSGQPVEEDAPTNFAGAGSGVDMNPTGMRKKKKKLIDARTREYKAHQKRLETARQRREERRKAASKINEEEIDEALKPKDKKVVDAFYDGKAMQGDTLSTDGKKLEKGGLGAQTVATSSGGKFKIVAKMDGRQTQSVVQYIKKSFPKDVVEETPIPFSQKVQEQIRGFDRESLLAEDTVDVLKSIVKNKSAKPIKLKDGTMKVDMFTASAIVKVLDKINPANKAKLTKMLNGKKSDFMRAADGIMKIVGKSR